MEIEIDILEKEIQSVFKKLPNICCDVPSHLFIIQSLLDAFRNASGRELSSDY